MSEPTSANVYTDTREHLLDELVRIDLLIRRYLEAWWAERGADSDGFPELFISDEEVDRLVLSAPEALERIRTDTHPTGQPVHHEDEIETITEAVRRRAQASVDAGIQLRLFGLAAEFDLSPVEIDAFVLALAPDIDPKYERIYGYLRDDITQTRPTAELLGRILTRSDVERLSVMDLFSQRSNLVSEGLLRVEEGPTIPSRIIRVEERVVEYVRGSDAIDGALGQVVSVDRLDSPTSMTVMEDDRQDALDAIGDRMRDYGDPQAPAWLYTRTADEASSATQGGRPLMVGFMGLDERTAEAAVDYVCRRAEVPVIRVDASALASADANDVLAAIRREARLQGGAIHVTSMDVLEPELRSPFAETQDGTEVRRRDDDRLERVLSELDRFPGDVVLTGDASISAEIQPALEHHRYTEVSFPRPDFEERTAMWGAVEGFPEGADPAALAGTYRLTRGDIEDAVATARALTGGDLTTSAIREACRLHSRQELDELAKEIEPAYDWDDIVLPEDTMTHLREIAGGIRHRGTVFEEWGFADRFSLGNGINILFTGKSGTGKTMAAEIIANDVGLPLYKLDLSSVMSKYIGETEKNLRRVFDAAENSNAILFFDEADALFGKRTEISDAHDRYANVEVDYLLQRMEEHDGCVILASNLKENIDEAFRRRINASVSFPMPDEDARREIWRLIFPEQTPRAEIDVDFLAGFKLSGGYIKNVALTASFLAAEDGNPVDMSHVVQALRREFQKTGKLYDLEVFGPYADVVR